MPLMFWAMQASHRTPPLIPDWNDRYPILSLLEAGTNG